MKSTVLKLSLCTIITLSSIGAVKAQGWQAQALNRLIAINAVANAPGQLSPIHVGIGTDANDLLYQAEVFNSIPDAHLAIAGSGPSIRFQNNVLWDSSSVGQADLGLATAAGQFVPGSVAGDFIVQNRKSKSLILGTGGGGGVERARIDASGFLGINTASHPAATVLDRFDVNLVPGEFVRIENMPEGDYHIVTMDLATGRLYVSAKATTGGGGDSSSSDSSSVRLAQKVDNTQTSVAALQNEVASLKDEITTLNAKLNDLANCCASNAAATKTDATTARVSTNILYQNAPNPFSKTTSIGYEIGELNSSASIMISDMNGKQLSVYPINQTGKGNIIVNVGTLSSGMYLYTLIVDHIVIDSKKMIIDAQ